MATFPKNFTINVVAAGVQPPPQAVAAGYTNPALISEFDSASEVTTNNPQGSANWSTFFNGQDAAHMLSSSQYDVTGGILTLHTGVNGFAGGVTTGQPPNAAISRPGAIATNSGNGTLYQYGYFEACFKFDPTTVISPGDGPNAVNGQPAWWGIGQTDGGSDWGEIDVMESFQDAGATFFGAFIGSGIINWYGSNSGFSQVNANGPLFGSGGGTGLQGSPGNDFMATSGIDPADFNIAGCLWTPTSISIYYNSATRRANGIADTLVQQVSTVVPQTGSRDFTSDPSQGAAGQKPPLTYDGFNTSGLGSALTWILAAGPGTPVQFRYVHIWQ